MRYQPTVEDMDDVHVSACSVERMQRPDHKAKKHGRPARRNEKLGGGFFVFRRHADNRIHPGASPFEHGDYDGAATEALRLSRTGDTFEVYGRMLSIGGDRDAADAIDDYVTEGSGDLYGDAPQAGAA
jgi:hypothetical protein